MDQREVLLLLYLPNHISDCLADAEHVRENGRQHWMYWENALLDRITPGVYLHLLASCLVLAALTLPHKLHEI